MKFRVLIFTFALLIFSQAAPAQTSRGTVSGTVLDPNGAVIPGTTVTLTNDETNVIRTTVTNNEGLYRFDAVDLGTYAVRFTAANFGEVTKTGIVVNANQIAEVGAELTPSGQQVTIDVTADASAQLQTEAPVRGGNISPRQITELPIAARNPVSLTLTLPGVSTNRYGAGVATFSVNGARQRSNNFLIDGTENNDISVAGQGFQIRNPDAVQEVSVQTSNYDAEFGRAGGAVVNTITRAGANDFHGTLSYLGDSTRDDAITSSQALDPEVLRRGHPLPGTEQWFSGTVGGPVLLPRFGEGGPAIYNGRNRTFFFFAAQNRRQLSQSQSTLTTLSPAGRATLRTLFPAGTNPRVDNLLGITEGVDATSRFFTQDLGLGRGAVEFGTGIASYAQKLRSVQYLGRIDHKLGESDQLSVRYLYDNVVEPTGGAFGFNFPSLITSSKNRYQNFLITENHVFSPTVTNELRLSYNRIKLSFPLDPANPLGLTQPGIQITGISTTATTGTNLAVNSNFPQGRVANNYVVQDTVTILRGNHTFRFGLDLLQQRSKQLAPIAERGNLVYGASSIAGGQSFSAFANYVDDFGGTGSATKDIGSPAYYPELFRQAYFFQDRWRATESLTLTLGLRYENFGTPFNNLRTPAFTGLFNIDPVTFTGPFNQSNQIPRDNNNFAPTIGIAYSPRANEGFFGRLFGEDQTVIRAGYQIGYDSFYNNLASNAATAAPNLVATSVSSSPSASSPRGLANLSASFPTTRRAVTPRDSQGNLLAPNLVNPYYQRWSLGVQRALPGNVVLDLSYVGSKGTRLYITEDLNPLVPENLRVTPAGYTGPRNCTPGTNITAGQALPGFPTGSPCPLTGRLDNLQGSRNIRTNGGDSNYHSGQLNVTRRFTNGLQFTGAYTWSKLIDNGSDTFAQGQVNSQALTALPSPFGGLRVDRAVSLFDRTHRAVFTYVYALPFLREQRGPLGRLLGGFEVSGVTTFESGVPLNIVAGLDSDGIGSNFDRPDYNPTGRTGVRARPADATSPSATGFVNPDAVIGRTSAGADIFQPIDPRDAQYIALPTGTGRTGNLGRNVLRTPGINNFDFNIIKRTRLTENTRLELRAEFFNIFNHPQYGVPSESPFKAAQQGIGGNIFSTAPGRFLDPTFADAGGRVVRYQLKFVF